jgi:thiol-disulfide isomerase/thioredoxin
VSDRLQIGLAAGLVAALISANVAIKPGFDPAKIREVVDAVSGNGEWHDRPVEDFELRLRDGSAFKLSDHIGREVIVLNFFATWCQPCRAEMPELQYFAKQMADQHKPFLLVGIDAEEAPELVDEFLRRYAIAFPVAIDSGGVLKQYGVDAFPTTVVIGADGRIKLYEAGAISNADVALAPILAPEFVALASPASTPDGRRVEWEAALKARTAAPRRGWTPPDSNGELSGRALAIAKAMPCPCGCDDRVISCNCHTAKGIKARLREGIDKKVTDSEVMQQLNKEFCMKGM